MADQHVNGAVSTTKGMVKESIGKLTGDRKLETMGKLERVEGKAQNGLADVEDAVHKVGDA